jgi:hypothetical protein
MIASDPIPSPPRLAIWLEWLDVIDHEVTSLYFHRDLWQQMAKALDSNPQVPRTHALSMVHLAYGASQAAAVRRLVDDRNDVVSLTRLLRDIEANARSVTLEWWLSLYPDPSVAAWAGARDWNKEFGASPLDRNVPRDDLNSLLVDTGGVKIYVDKYVAHRADKQPPPITFTELNAAIDAIGRAFQRYYLLLKAAGRSPISPVVLGDQMASFRVPWLPQLGRRGSAAADQSSK